jgi:hypothetical protein
MWCNSYRADDRGFESNQTLCNWYLLLEISAKYPRIRIESKDWLAMEQELFDFSEHLSSPLF